MEQSSHLLVELMRSAQQLGPDAFQAHALKTIASICPFDSAMWGLGKFSVDAPTHYECMHLHHVDDSVFTEFNKVADKDAVGIEVAKRSAQSVAAFNVEECAKDSRFADFVAYTRQFGLNNILYAVKPDDVAGFTEMEKPNTPSDHKHFIALFRSGADSRFTTDDIEKVSALILGAIEGGIISNLLSHSRLLKIGYESGFVHATASTAGVLRWCDGGFIDLMRQQWESYRGPFLRGALRRSLEELSPRTFVGEHMIASAVLSSDQLFIVACANSRGAELEPQWVDVVRLVAAGHPTKRIAKIVGRPDKRVRKQLSKVYAALGLGPGHSKTPTKPITEASKRAALVRWWLSLPEEHLQASENKASSPQRNSNLLGSTPRTVSRRTSRGSRNSLPKSSIS